MAKVTSKYQVTLPKVIADQFQIRPGDQIYWAAAGDAIRVTPASRRALPEDKESQLRWFDLATERQRRRGSRRGRRQLRSRGWKREDLYQRGRAS